MTQLNTTVRKQVRYYWNSLANVNVATTGGSSLAQLGTAGNTLQRVVLDEAATSRIEHLTQIVAKGDDLWKVGEDPIMRVAIKPSSLPTNGDFFVGFRQTKNGTVPTTEHHAGVWWDGSAAAFKSTQGSGAAQSTSPLDTPTADEVMVIEIDITGGTSVVYRINGKTVATVTGSLPSGNVLAWQHLLVSDAGGAAENFELRSTMMRIAEDL